MKQLVNSLNDNHGIVDPYKRYGPAYMNEEHI